MNQSNDSLVKTLMVDLTKRAVYIGYLSELQNESREAIAFMKKFFRLKHQVSPHTVKCLE